MRSDVRLTIEPRGPFSLAQSMAFLDRFDPLGAGPVGDGRLRMAFTDEDGAATAFSAGQTEPDGPVDVRAATALGTEALRGHVAGILSLDVDAAGLDAVGRRDPAVAALLQRYPGRRPVCFGTPFEAAAWAVISQRIRMAQAAQTKARMASALGEAVEVDGHAVHAFPAPAALAGLEQFPGLWPAKAQRLRALARAADDGALDPALLRGLPVPEALAHLEALPGLGPWSAALVLVRGAGHPDIAPMAAKPFRAAVGAMYDRDPASLDEAALAEIAAGWRPYRSWVSFLARNALDDA